MWCLKCIMGDTLDARDEQKEEAQSDTAVPTQIEARKSL